MSARNLLMVLLLCLPSALLARDWQLVADASRLGFTGEFDGRAFAGSFKQFDAEIHFDPNQLKRARFDVRIDLSSVNTGSNDRDDFLTGADFFAVDQWPQARFVTDSISRNQHGAIIATGTLTLRGTSQPVVLSIAFKPTAQGATLDVKTSVNRLDFGVGQGDNWTGISEQIPVHGHLVLR